jgi:hypothetical protein
MQGQETTTTQLKPTRASFIRGLPESMPVAEVIERGREAGLDINPTDVHSARYYMRQAGGPQPAANSAFAPAAEQTGPIAVPAKRDPARDPAKEPPRPSGAQYIPRRTITSATSATSATSHGNVTAKPRAVAPAAQAATKTRTKYTTKATDSLEEQLRLIVMRIGTDRARAVIEEVEELALRE